MASIYLPPIARKKKVDGHPRQDTSRVFADLQGDYSPGKTSYDAHYIGHALHFIASAECDVCDRIISHHPTNVTFLRQNPRFICEPICYVKTTVILKYQVHHGGQMKLPEKNNQGSSIQLRFNCAFRLPCSAFPP
ncbi:hypothetical protein OS493_039252 [Desmophyllum pertusum]|uniref:Uncharacterized protein n=1 Tax=Desmophyllum pertusum TaxID=174260 RepID=A0A9X0CVF3_9CNID|nr:hypothetical protein OS493_039252 [Desmophyllum pertusum]